MFFLLYNYVHGNVVFSDSTLEIKLLINMIQTLGRKFEKNSRTIKKVMKAKNAAKKTSQY